MNSAWSRDALLGEGIPAEKIRLIPLAYEPLTESSSFQRHYPRAFSSERPLRVLFLGQINLRKGVRQLLDAVKILARENVEFWFVGPIQIDIAKDLEEHPQCKWFGIAPRVEVNEYYKRGRRIYSAHVLRRFCPHAVGGASVEASGNRVSILR